MHLAEEGGEECMAEAEHARHATARKKGGEEIGEHPEPRMYLTVEGHVRHLFSRVGRMRAQEGGGS